MNAYPLWFNCRESKNIIINYSPPKQIILRASFLIVFREFPQYSFPPGFDKGSIYFNTKTRPDFNEILERVKLVLKGDVKPPIIESLIKTEPDPKIRRSKFIKFRSKPVYLSFHPSINEPLLNWKKIWKEIYEISNFDCSTKAVYNYYRLFLKCSRLIHIALYYYCIAASLTRENYIEDAGINLHLSLEAIIADFMELHSIRNKRKAVEKLISNIWPPKWGTEYFLDLWESRNSFLAHIDKNMFTKNQRIHDPDFYCYETFESITFLITRYIRYKNRKINLKR